MFQETETEQSVVSSYPLTDGPVQAAMKRFEVQHPPGAAGVDAVVVEHAVNRDVLPRSDHQLLRDVADR